MDLDLYGELDFLTYFSTMCLITSFKTIHALQERYVCGYKVILAMEVAQCMLAYFGQNSVN